MSATYRSVAELIMQHAPITAQRRFQIFMTGLAPLAVLCLILAMAAQNGLDVVSLFTKIEQRDAANYVIVTKIIGIAVSSRPATQSDLMEEDAVMRVVKTAVLVGSFIIMSGSLLMCYVSVTGKPRSVLIWLVRKLGSVGSA